MAENKFNATMRMQIKVETKRTLLQDLKENKLNYLFAVSLQESLQQKKCEYIECHTYPFEIGVLSALQVELRTGRI